MDDKLKKLLDSIGAMAEMVGELGRRLEENGYCHADALYLCGKAVQAMFTIMPREKEDGED